MINYVHNKTWYMVSITRIWNMKYKGADNKSIPP